MERILTYIIDTKNNGIQTEHFLKLNNYSAHLLTALRKDMTLVRINNTPSRLIDRLYCNDRLTVCIRDESSSEHIPPVKLPLDIVYEDDDIIVLNKPAGMPIHPSMDNYYNSMANGLAWYYASQNQSFVFRCTNRLDRDTSGLTVVAKNALSSSVLSSMGARHEIKREYLAIVKGRISPSDGIITAPIGRKPGSIIERYVDFESGERAVTHYSTVCFQEGHSLLRIVLETGRTHQIRIHMKYAGCPLIGDYLYNPDMEHISRQALHSWRLSFAHPITGASMNFEAKMPQDMENVLGHVCYPL